MTTPKILILTLATLAPTLTAQETEDWPQWRGTHRDGVWREDGITSQLPEELIPRWRVPLGNGYSGPSVANGRVYVMDRVEEPEEIERVHCLSWEDGEILWTHEYPATYRGVSYTAGPRCSVLIEDGLAYTLGTMGHLFCLNAASGDVVWEKNLLREYDTTVPMWGITAAPLIEGDLLIVPACGEDAYLIAFDSKTGEEKWKALSDGGNYSAPIVIDQAGRRVVVIWTAERIVGVDAQSGALHWQHPFKPASMVLGVPSPVPYQDLLFITGFYDGGLLLRVDPDELTVEEVWHRRGRNELSTDALHSTISTPIVRDGYIYGVDSYGELRCLELMTGDRVWEDLTAVPKARWANMHLVPQGDRVWIFNERGELVIAEISPDGFAEIDRALLIRPTLAQLNQRDGVTWSHPAFAYRHVFARNDEELICVDLSAR